MEDVQISVWGLTIAMWQLSIWHACALTSHTIRSMHGSTLLFWGRVESLQPLLATSWDERNRHIIIQAITEYQNAYSTTFYCQEKLYPATLLITTAIVMFALLMKVTRLILEWGKGGRYGNETTLSLRYIGMTPPTELVGPGHSCAIVHGGEATIVNCRQQLLNQPLRRVARYNNFA